MSEKSKESLIGRRRFIKSGAAVALWFGLYNRGPISSGINFIFSGPSKNETTDPSNHDLARLPALPRIDSLPVKAEWSLNPDFENVIDSLNHSAENKEFIKFAIRAVAEVIATGAPVNPRVMVAQAAFETGYGKHLAGQFNYFGIKAADRDRNATETMTFEDYGQGKVKVKQRFKNYNPTEPLGSFYDYAHSIATRRYYKDASDMRFNDHCYLLGLENVVNNSCQVVGEQGGYYHGEKVRSYGTDRDYTDKMLNMVDVWDLGQVFQPAL